MMNMFPMFGNKLSYYYYYPSHTEYIYGISKEIFIFILVYKNIFLALKMLNNF